MASFQRASKSFLYAILVLLALIQISECSKKPAGAARKEDIPYIKCQVCEKLAHQLYYQVHAKEAEISPKKISEYQIIEISENVCNLKKPEADWMLKIDIVEQEDRLELVEQGSEGNCNSECKTIERACQEVMGYSDTDVAEYLYKNKPQLDSLVKYLCKDLTGACIKKPPKVPQDRIPGETFIPKSSKEAEMDKILKSMEGMPGAPGMKMYSRDDLMNMKGFGGAEDGDEDEDEDENEAEFPAKLGKVVKEQESKKKDWRQRIVKGIVDTSNTLKKQANKVSNQITRWWKGKKAVSKKKNSKKNNAEL